MDMFGFWRRFFIVAGIILIGVGLLWPWFSRLDPLSGPWRLPGDIAIHRQNVHIYVPLMTSLVVSVVLTLLFWLLRK
ncbi:MAG: DUF2905 domain-containing protein [Proteobacteria bacterium]|nr:DUF2905 domain-containing protein [Pseudomonadota bacterium]